MTVPKDCQNTMADIIIIGGGITGLTTAYRLMNDQCHGAGRTSQKLEVGYKATPIPAEPQLTKPLMVGWTLEPKVLELIQSLGLDIEPHPSHPKT